jgi:kynurenine formamidase
MTEEQAAAEDLRVVGRRLSNWGRWSDADQMGTLNFVQATELIGAASLVRQGKVISMGLPLGADGPQPGPLSADGRINPIHVMTELGTSQAFRGDFRYADDYLFLPLQAATQWDALAHVHYDGMLYNGFPAALSLTRAGAKKCSIEAASRGIVGRGVLLDVPRHRGVAWLGAGEAVGPDELDAVAAAEGVSVTRGDIVLVRTGWWRMFLESRSPTDFMRAEPGLGFDCATWLHERQVAAVAADNFAVEALHVGTDGLLEGEVPGQAFALHMVLIRDMGMWLGELFDLEELAEDCARDGVYEFFFCAPALRVSGGVGSPLNPLAIK